MGLEYNFDEKQLVSVFHQYRNDINIYTEDCDKDKSFYKQLLGRLMDKRIAKLLIYFLLVIVILWKKQVRKALTSVAFI